MIKNPLVSVIVVTYNSSDFIIETLESCKNQTYQNLELIISDDCSSDNTIELCKEWLKFNTHRFQSIKLVEANQNTGIAGNVNRGIKESTGVWYKHTPGDDLLPENCIKDNIDFINSSNENIEVLLSRRVRFKSKSGTKEFLKNDEEPNVFFNKNISVKDQIKLTLRFLIKPKFSWFTKKEVYQKVGGYDENFQLYDDKPFRLRMMFSGYKLYWLNKTTFYHRLRTGSVGSQLNQEYIYTGWELNHVIPAHYKYIYPRLSLIEKMAFNYDFAVTKLTFHSILNKKNRLTKLINKILILPARVIQRLTQKLVLLKMNLKYKSF